MVIILCIFTMFVGCSGEVSVSMSDIEKHIIDHANLEKMDKGDVKLLKKLYGINANDLDGGLLYVPKSNMDVDEMLIVKVKDVSQIDAIEESIEARVSKQLSSFQGYGIEQAALLENYEIKIKDKYIFFAVAENAELLKEEFKEILKK